MIHLYDQAATFSPPVDCFVSFQGPFVLTDSALAFPAILQPIKMVIRVPRLRMPRRCTFSADAGGSPVSCRHNLSEADWRQGSAIDVFIKLTASPSFNPPTSSTLCALLLLQVHYKKGHHERKAKYTSLADPPEVELARKADQQRSDVSTQSIGAGGGINADDWKIWIPHNQDDLQNASIHKQDQQSCVFSD